MTKRRCSFIWNSGNNVIICTGKDTVYSAVFDEHYTPHPTEKLLKWHGF